MNKIFLYILSWLNPVWEALGADSRQLHGILTTKLTMDDRRPSTLQMGRQRRKETGNSTLLTAFISLLYGFFMMAIVIGMQKQMLTGLTIYFGMFIVMLALTLISDFTSVLIDVRDNYIVLPRPVNDCTVLLARLLHISVHLSKIVIPMAVPGIIYLGIAYGASGAALMILMVFLATILTIFLINLVYLLILQITTPAKFKEIINYIQIGFTIFIFAFYELFPRLMNNKVLGNIDLRSHHWIYYVPPFWLASVWSVIMDHQFQQTLIITAGLAIIIPLLSVWVVIRFFAPSFNKKLSSINSSSDESKPVTDIKVKATQRSLPRFLSNLLIRNKTERAGFIFGWKLTSRSRDFKLKVYPMFGYVIVLFFLFMFGGFSGNTHKIQGVDFYKKGPGILFIIYLCSIMIADAVVLIKSSDKYKAAWVYYISPVQKPGILIRGMMKMLLFKYFFLIYFVIVVLSLFLRGISFLPNLLLGLVNIIFVSLVLGLFYLKTFPFSEQWNINRSSGRMMRSFFLMIMVGILGVIHYFIMNFTIVVLILTILVAAADWLLLDKFRNISWEEMRTE